MSRASTITTLGTAIAMAAGATQAIAQDEAKPLAPEVTSQYSIVEANPERGTATIEQEVNGGANFVTTLGCDILAHQQERTESDIIRHASTFIAWGKSDEDYQIAKLELGLGHTTLSDLYEYASDETIARNEEHGSLTYAAILGADRAVMIEAQRQAGCHMPTTP